MSPAQSVGNTTPGSKARNTLGLLPGCAIAILALVVLAGCGGGSTSTSAPSVKLSPAAELGEKIFADASLSASGKLSCASCHDSTRAHAGADDLAVPFGGPMMNTPGFRNAPSLQYLDKTPAFYFAADGTPTGGFDRDGRAADLIAQAERPFLAAHEMANASAADVVTKLQAATYAAQFRQVFGDGIFSDADAAFQRARYALAQYEKESPEFHPYDSKYDQFLASKLSLSEQELRGLALFNDPNKGNCAACHISAKGTDGSAPLFTDFTYDNLGVPRNMDIPANADANYYDLGLCGPDRTDLTSHTDLCGAFKVPTLRNIAVTGPYFHNGAFKTLRDALRFYVRRDTNPEEFYPLDASGTPVKFNDLPPAYRGNVNVTEVPYNRQRGDAPALSDAEIDDVITFLQTLTDGYKP